jgi:hypothetical protein
MSLLASFQKCSKHWPLDTLSDNSSLLALPPLSLNDQKVAPIVHLTLIKGHINQAIISQRVSSKTSSSNCWDDKLDNESAPTCFMAIMDKNQNPPLMVKRHSYPEVVIQCVIGSAIKEAHQRVSYASGDFDAKCIPGIVFLIPGNTIIQFTVFRLCGILKSPSFVNFVLAYS